MVNARDLTKSQRRSLRDLSSTAHSRELSAALSILESDFRLWREGKIDAHELNQRVHAFHRGPSRKLHTAYGDSVPVLPVAFAIARGIIADSEVPDDLRETLALPISFAREHLASGEDESEQPDESP